MPSLVEILNSKIGKGRTSKAYVASKLNVSEKTIENYMNGKRQPRPDALIKLGNILSFDLSELSEQNVPRSTETGQISKVSDYKEKYIQSLERENLRLQRDLDISLGSLTENILMVLAICETNQELLVEYLSEGNRKKYAELIDNVSKRTGDNLAKKIRESKFPLVGN